MSAVNVLVFRDWGILLYGYLYNVNIEESGDCHFVVVMRLTS